MIILHFLKIKNTTSILINICKKHTEQTNNWGILWLPAYYIKGGNSADNSLEIEADEVARIGKIEDTENDSTILLYKDFKERIKSVKLEK